MYLPRRYLNKVEYYEKRVVEAFWCEGFRTIITLHFKQWWKPRKKFKFDWRFVATTGYGTTTWSPSEEAVIFERLLIQHFKDFKEVS